MVKVWRYEKYLKRYSAPTIYRPGATGVSNIPSTTRGCTREDGGCPILPILPQVTFRSLKAGISDLYSSGVVSLSWLNALRNDGFGGVLGAGALFCRA